MLLNLRRPTKIVGDNQRKRWRKRDRVWNLQNTGPVIGMKLGRNVSRMLREKNTQRTKMIGVRLMVRFGQLQTTVTACRFYRD